MLVLSRKKNEAVIIARGIRVCVVEIRGDKVRLGFEADPSVEIHREEVLNEIVWRERRDARQRELNACGPLDTCGPPGRCGRAGCDGLLQTGAELRAGYCRDCQGGGL